MITYHFSRSIKKDIWEYGTGEGQIFQTKEELIKDANDFFEDCGYELSKEDIDCIVSENLDYDFYSVQTYRDGFGNDTYTVCCFKTFMEAKKYVEKTAGDFEIVGQCWGDYYVNFYN